MMDNISMPPYVASPLIAPVEHIIEQQHGRGWGAAAPGQGHSNREPVDLTPAEVSAQFISATHSKHGRPPTNDTPNGDMSVLPVEDLAPVNHKRNKHLAIKSKHLFVYEFLILCRVLYFCFRRCNGKPFHQSLQGLT